MPPRRALDTAAPTHLLRFGPCQVHVDVSLHRPMTFVAEECRRTAAPIILSFDTERSKQDSRVIFSKLHVETKCLTVNMHRATQKPNPADLPRILGVAMKPASHRRFAARNPTRGATR